MINSQPLNIKLEHIFLDGKWHQNQSVTSDNEGKIVIDHSKAKSSQYLTGHYLPSFVNFHSHAFQYAMAGSGEFFRRGGGEDFWSWRKEMYALALAISPEDLLTLARVLYLELLKNGYDTATEFHYLHHDPNGARYDDPTTMSKVLIKAAEDVGLNIILSPVYYHNSDFGCKAHYDQRRFTFNSPEEYLTHFQSLKALEKTNSHLTVLPGAHSLRAAPKEHLIEIYEATKEDFHIHISEQQKEIDACIQFYGRRPVEWLLESISEHQRLQLIHATHLNRNEISMLSTTGAL